MDPGAAIRAARLRAGLTQTELAARSATSQATLCAYERRGKMPSADTLARVLAAAGTRLVTVPATRPVRTPAAAELRRAAHTLDDVLGLAAELPTRHGRELRFPRLPATPGR